MTPHRALPPLDAPGERPGFVCAHTHLYSALVPFGMPPPAEPPARFLDILERVWWRLDRALDERAIVAAARLYVAEALLAGTTTLVDHHESPELIEGSLDLLADACQELGMRALLCYGASERNGGRDEAERGLAECRRFLHANRRPLVRGCVGLHASFTVSDETLQETGWLCEELGSVLHVHMAEDDHDVADARRRGHAGPLERLIAHGALPSGSILAHGTHLRESEVRQAGKHQLWLVQNARSNEGNGVGYARALWAGERVALGTDGYPADMREELAALKRIARDPGHSEPADDDALQRRLEAGRDLAAGHFTREALAHDRITLGPGPGGRIVVERVTVEGRTVVENGRLATGDLGELRARAAEAAPALWRRMEALV
jgi:cytosine/adenosine deaminase-related metal-dependent hydrolase